MQYLTLLNLIKPILPLSSILGTAERISLQRGRYLRQTRLRCARLPTLHLQAPPSRIWSGKTIEIETNNANFQTSPVKDEDGLFVLVVQFYQVLVEAGFAGALLLRHSLLKSTKRVIGPVLRVLDERHRYDKCRHTSLRTLFALHCQQNTLPQTLKLASIVSAIYMTF